MKKIASILLLTFFMLTALCGCGDAPDDGVADVWEKTPEVILQMLFDEICAENQKSNPEYRMDYYTQAGLTEGLLKSRFGVQDAPAFVSGQILYPPISPDTTLVLAVIRLEDEVKAEELASYMEEHMNRMVQVCVGYPELFVFRVGDTVVAAMGEKRTIDPLASACEALKNGK